MTSEVSTPDILTPRLELIAITLEMIQAGSARSPNFADLVNADLPPEWPPEGWDVAAYEYMIDKMTRYPDARGWGRYIAVKPANGHRRTLIGTCGCTLPIELSSDPEIGYGILPSYQRQGYASEAVAGLVAWIFTHSHVRSVNAQTFPHLEGSLRVMIKNGLQLVGPGPGPEEGTVLYRRFRE